jgi:protein-S-isoprenylcysteine O-methyltransferase Ste14
MEPGALFWITALTMHALFAVLWNLSSVNAAAVRPYIMDCWIVFLVVWLLWAFWRKGAKQRESLVTRLPHVLTLVVGFELLFDDRLRVGWLGARFWPDLPSIAITGLAATALGVALAIWARVHLGKNWSAVVSIREGHELIRTGPYRNIRHPIYTGLLLATLGSALPVGQARVLIALPIIFAAIYIKARKEESWLAQEFGDKFAEHKKHTGMFLPRLSGPES